MNALAKIVERVRVGNVLVQKDGVVLLTHLGRQSGHSGFDIANDPKIQGGSTADVPGIRVDLDFLHIVPGHKFREWKVSASGFRSPRHTPD